MIKKRISLTYFRQEIGKILKESEKNGLYNIPYQTYNKSPNRIKKRLIKKYNNLENELLSCIKGQERVYLLLCDLKNKTYNTTISQKDILDLFLNTDTKLIYEPLPLNEKINKAQELLTEKISNAKNVLLDIYYIHKTIIVETYRIGWEPNSEINLEIRSVMEKHFLLNKSYSTSQDYYLLKQIAETENFDIAYNLYYKNIDKFVDLVFIKINATDNSSFKPINLYKLFESIKGISRNLYSPFYGDKVNFISGEITQRINNKSYTQRNVSLDSNSVSYVRTIIDKNGNNLSLKIKESINDITLIKKIATSFDYIPYILENYTFSPENKDKLLKTITSVERYFYPTEEWFQKKKFDELKYLLNQDTFFKKVKNEYRIGYSLLLLMTYIHFKFSKMTSIEKLNNFCEYMDKVLFVFREPFVEIAYNFFSKIKSIPIF